MGVESKQGGEPEQKPNLSPEQEAGLKDLMPDFEPSGDESAKHGRAQAQREPDKETVQIISVAYAGVFALAAARLGDHWQLSADEVQSLAVPTVMVLDKYLPGAKVGVEVALLAAVAMVIFPRVLITMQQKPIDAESEAVSNGDKSEHQQA